MAVLLASLAVYSCDMPDERGHPFSSSPPRLHHRLTGRSSFFSRMAGNCLLGAGRCSYFTNYEIISLPSSCHRIQLHDLIVNIISSACLASFILRHNYLEACRHISPRVHGDPEICISRPHSTWKAIISRYRILCIILHV